VVREIFGVGRPSHGALHGGSCTGRPCRQSCLPTPHHEHTWQHRCGTSASPWSSSLLPKSSGSHLLPQTPPAYARRCPQEPQAGESSLFPLLMKAASAKVGPPSLSGFSRLFRLCPSRWAAQAW